MQGLNLTAGGAVISQRPELSNRRSKVADFKVPSHDGTHLLGLYARPTWVRGKRPFRLRSVSHQQPLQLDPASLEKGVAEFVFQVPEGRALRDRVLDVVAVVRMAQGLRGIHPQCSDLLAGPQRPPDEFLIAQHLFKWNLVASLP